MTKLGEFYSWVWYHTEFWIADKLQRRPYTYIMRDWIYTHGRLALTLIVAWYVLTYVLSLETIMGAITLAIGSSLILAHLAWGSKWIPQEQEEPPYNPDSKSSS